MQALKRSFKKVKDHNKISGNERKTCKYYEILQEIFEREPWIEPVAVAGTSVEDEKENEDIQQKTIKKNVLALLLGEKKMSRQDANTRHKEKMERLDKLQHVLEKLAKKEIGQK
ncbi:uncharacterized protein [Prorops nasuta]|uniref:uncharacterized protein n=1 Tax=Prorops nasuta TaxID=863751 RepID=UPI0034CED6ED